MGFQSSPSPFPLHHISLEKSCFKLLPWLVLLRQSSVSCICLSCHVSVCCEPRHDIPSRLAYHGNKVTLCENGKVVAFQKTGWRTSAANGKAKKKKLVWVDEGIAFKRQTQLPPMSMESLTQTLMAMESCPKALYFLGWCQIVVSQTKLLCYYNKVFFDSTT